MAMPMAAHLLFHDSYQGQGHKHDLCYVWRSLSGARNIHTCAFRKPGTWFNSPSSRPVARRPARNSPPATPSILNYVQVWWSYCIISLSLLHHPPVLHDGYLVRPVHQILLTRPSLFKNDPFPFSFSLKFSPYHHPLLSELSSSLPPIGASFYPESVVHPTISKAGRVYYSYIPRGSYTSPLPLVLTNLLSGNAARGLFYRLTALLLIATLHP